MSNACTSVLTTAVIVVLAGLVATSVAPVRAASAPEPKWEAIKPAVVKVLSRHLNRWEVHRLLRKRHVRRAFVAALRGYDGGVEDRVLVEREGRAVIVTFLDRSRRRICMDPGPTLETDHEPACEEVVEIRDRKTLRLDPDLWAPRRKNRRPRSGAWSAKVKRPESVLFGGYARKASRRRLAMLGISPKVTRLVGSYWGFRDGIKRSRRFKDPFEAPFRVGDAPDPVTPRNAETPKPAGSLEGNAMENLRYIYDVSRMRPGWPVPDPFGLSARPTARNRHDPTTVPAPTKECLQAFNDTHNPSTPPGLQCFQNALRFRRLDRDQAYQVARWIGSVLKLPILNDIMKLRVRERSAETTSTTLWAHTWMQWATRNPSKVPDALRSLSDKERMHLRWKLSRWWFDPHHGTFESTIATIYERFFADLYPNARGPHGWPQRSRFNDDYLWALNWMATAERAPREAVAAHRRLPAPDRAIIAALVADASHQKRFPKTVAAVSL